mgnify:CR=1 FL=1
MESVLTINQLRKRYGNIEAVKDLTIQIPRGSVYGILGPNGSGKTTTLGMILGVVRPTSGEFTWFDGQPNKTSKRRTGALLETPNFYPYLSGRKNLELVAKIKEIENPEIDTILKSVNLHQRASSPFSSYSLGMKQRLAIASALIGEPEVLILDEPTNGLDPRGIAEVRQLIRDIASRGITVLLASHMLDEIEKVCTHVAILKSGSLIFEGDVDTLMGTEGFIELNSDHQEILLNYLQKHPAAKSVEIENGLVRMILQQELDTATLNKELQAQGIYLNHLVFRKHSLETQFLNLIDQK